jgi:hypothetical protein
MKKVLRQLLVASRSYLALCESDAPDVAEYPKLKSALKNAILAAEGLPESKPEPVNPCPFIGKCGNENRNNCKCCNDDGHWYLYSEKEPEKNCGNCGSLRCNICKKQSEPFTFWQPKPAEPQGWEQRFNGKFSADFYAMATKHMDNVRAFIRAEIDRAWGDGFKAGHDIAEENRSNE